MMPRFYPSRNILDGWLLAAMMFSLASSWSFNILVFKKIYFLEFSLAWLLAFANHFIGLLLKKIALDKPVIPFLTFAIGLNVIKGGCFLLTIFLILTRLAVDVNAFIIALVFSFLVFFIFEIIVLNFLSKTELHTVRL